MLLLWVAAYGGIYFLAEYLSGFTDAPHLLTGIAIVVYAAILLVWSGKKRKRFPLRWKANGRQIIGLIPLLCLPIVNLLIGAFAWNFSFAILMIGTSVAEEVFFRGYLKNLPREKRWAGVVASGFLFALLHLVNLIHNPPAVVLTQAGISLVTGVCFGCLCIYFDSILPSILLHVAVNLTGMGDMRVDLWRVLGLCAYAVVYLAYSIAVYKKMRRSKEV